MGLNQTDTFMVLNPRETWRKPDPAWLADQLRAVMVDFPGIGFSFTQPIDMRVSEMLTGVRGDLAIKIFGPDLATLNKLAVEVENTVKKVKGAEDTFTLKNDGVQYLKIAVDRLAAGRFGLNVDDIQNDLKALLEGRNVGTVMRCLQRHVAVTHDVNNGHNALGTERRGLIISRPGSSGGESQNCFSPLFLETE